MTFPVIEGSAAYNSGASALASHDITLPTGMVNGELLIMFVWANGSSTNINQPSGWTTIKDSSGVGRNIVAYREVDGTEGTVKSVTFSPGQQGAGLVLRISGWNNASGPEISTSNFATTTSHDPLSLTASWGEEDTLWLAALVADQDTGTDAITSYPSNYAQVAESTNSGLGVIGVGSRNLRASSDDPGAFTINSSQQGWPYTIAVRPSAAGGGGGGQISTPLLCMDHFNGGMAL